LLGEKYLGGREKRKEKIKKKERKEGRKSTPTPRFRVGGERERRRKRKKGYKTGAKTWTAVSFLPRRTPQGFPCRSVFGSESRGDEKKKKRGGGRKADVYRTTWWGRALSREPPLDLQLLKGAAE